MKAFKPLFDVLMPQGLTHALGLLILLNHPSHAELFAQADLKAGESLVKSQCVSCHATRFEDPGDGSSLYTRANRKVNTVSALVTQVRTCNTNLGLKWFDDDELNVAAYLNHQYYHLPIPSPE